jgi:hypothetical protein
MTPLDKLATIDNALREVYREIGDAARGMRGEFFAFLLRLGERHIMITNLEHEGRLGCTDSRCERPADHTDFSDNQGSPRPSTDRPGCRSSNRCDIAAAQHRGF